MADIVLLHPFPVDHTFWDEVAPVLESAGHRVIAPDLPGFGARPEEPGWTMDAEADRLADEVPTGATVVGLSMGGYLALALLARRPQVVGALVLADTRAEGEPPDGLEARRAAAEGLRTSGSGPFLEAFIPRAMWPGAAPAAVARLQQLASAQSAGAMADATMAIAGRTDHVALLPVIQVPALVVVGEHDAVTPPAVATAMAASVRGARLAVMGEAGHMTALEYPAEFADLVLSLTPGGQSDNACS
jgi:pimeloyl-ACP methyl ester carboxylesterase